MLKKVNAPKNISALLLILTFVLILQTALLGWVYKKSREAADSVSFAYNNLINLETINFSLHLANAQKNSFLLTGFEYYLDSYKKAVSEFSVKMEELKKHASSEADIQKENLLSINLSLNKNISEMDSTLKTREESGLSGLKQGNYFGKKSAAFKDFELNKNKFESIQKDILREKKLSLKKWDSIFYVGLAVIIFVSMLELFLLTKVSRLWKKN